MIVMSHCYLLQKVIELLHGASLETFSVWMRACVEALIAIMGVETQGILGPKGPEATWGQTVRVFHKGSNYVKYHT